jgi:hypothetical protein
MKFIAACIGLVLSTTLACAQQVRGIEVTEYGIYAVEKSDCHRDQQGIERCSRGNIRHAATTWTVPANIGVEFGLRYRVVGAPPGARLTIKRVWLLPKPGFRPPSGPAIDHLDRADAVFAGEDTLVTYGFDDPWELVPGHWTIRFYYDDRLIGEREFTMVTPKN